MRVVVVKVLTGLMRKIMTDKEVVLLVRDTEVTLVPSGASIRLPKDTEVLITQSLGDSYTISVYGNLARIDAKDADAIGKKAKNILEDLPADATVQDKIWAQLHTIFDPEIPVNIVDLGLIYRCDIETLNDQTVRVLIDMTLTAPGCGMGPHIADEVKRKTLLIPEVSDAVVELVFDPPWDRSRISDVAKLQLGIF